MAHHVGEQVSRSSLILPIAFAIAFLLDVSGNAPLTVLDLIINRPGSRTQEVRLTAIVESRLKNRLC